MEDKEIVQIFLGTQEWQTFECKRAAIRPSQYSVINDKIVKENFYFRAVIKNLKVFPCPPPTSIHY